MPKLCVDIIWDCIVLHGHIGYSTELPEEIQRRFEMADRRCNPPRSRN
nr:hypothetical protein [Candidatus Freyarchaeota archaeon]